MTYKFWGKEYYEYYEAITLQGHVASEMQMKYTKWYIPKCRLNLQIVKVKFKKLHLIESICQQTSSSYLKVDQSAINQKPKILPDKGEFRYLISFTMIDESTVINVSKS